MEERSRQIFNRLKAISDAQRELIKANPFPHLERLQAQNAKLRAAVDEAYAILTGVHNFDYAADIAPCAEPSIVETCVRQNSEAAAKLRNVLFGS